MANYNINPDMNSLLDASIPIDIMYTPEVLSYPGDTTINIDAFSNSVLIVGTAEDGPKYKPVLIDSIEAVEKRFGGITYEQITIPASGTSSSIRGSADGDAVDIYWRNGDDLIEYPLGNFAVSGTTLTFAAPGSGVVLIAAYRKADTNPLSHSLVRGVSEALLIPGVSVYAMRIGGDYATLDLVDILLRSIYPGDIYGWATATYTASSMIITQPPGKGEPRTYTFSYIGDLVRDINIDAAYGRSSVVASTSSPYVTGLHVGAGALTFGASGDFNTANLTEALEIITDLAADVVVLAGATDTEFFDLVKSYTDNFPYPTLVVMSAQDMGTLTTAEYVEALPGYTAPS